jgi:hypothetical protein
VADIIFAKPRHHYASYVDLYRLIELSGFPCVHFDQIDPYSDNVYIMTVLNGENNNGWQDPRAEIILYDLEWRLDANNGADGVGVHVPGVKRVWAADKWYAEAIGAEYVPLGSHAGLADGYAENDNGKVYDAAFMGYLGPYRRNNIVNRIRDNGVVIAEPAWAQERHDKLRASRCMLHVHQHDGIQTVAPQRWALAAAYGLPLISETVLDMGIFTGDYVMYASYDFLPQFVPMRLQRRGNEFDVTSMSILENYGQALYQLLCVERTFRANVEVVV